MFRILCTSHVLMLLTTLSQLAQTPLHAADEPYEVTAKVWAALQANNYEKVISTVDRSLEIWGDNARKINDSLNAYPVGESANKVAVLNEIGTQLWVKGEAQRRKGDTEDAIKTYKLLLEEYEYAQCWDNNGWWWKPVEAAKKKLAELEGQ